MAGGYVSSPNLPQPEPTWVPARDQVNTDARTVVSTTTKDTASGSSSKLTVSSSQASSTVINVFHTITENGSGGFLNSMGTINYAGKTITLKVVDPSASSTSYKNDAESASDFASASNGSSNDPGSNGVAGYTPANASSSSGSSGGSSSGQGGAFGSSAVAETLDASALWVTYRTGAGEHTPHTESFAPNVVTIDLAPYTTNRVVPNSIRFTWMTHVYEDLDGVLYRDPTATTPGTRAGMVDYIKGIAYVTDYIVSGSPTDFVLDSLWTSKGDWTTSRVFCRTPAAPVKPGGFVMTILGIDGQQIIATANINGQILGDHCLGRMSYETGIVDLIFGDQVTDASLTDAQKLEWWYPKALAQITADGKVWKPWPVDPTSLRYNAVTYFYLPIDAEQLGLDPVRLPPDGRVPIFRRGGFAVVGHTGTTPASVVSNGQTINCARPRLSRLKVVGSDGLTIDTGYTTDLDAGTVTFTNVSGYAQPVTVQHRIEDLARISDVQINGRLGFTRQLSHDFPAGSFVSSALVAGNLKARVSGLFDQQTWDKLTWSDTLIGNQAPASYNDTLAPVVVTNAGALTERWALHFTSSTSFEIIGEHIGIVGTGSINTALAPINPITGTPYFTLSPLGWGIGWTPGNVLFLQTVGAICPFACIRTVQQSTAPGTDFSFSLLARGGVDRP